MMQIESATPGSIDDTYFLMIVEVYRITRSYEIIVDVPYGSSFSIKVQYIFEVILVDLNFRTGSNSSFANWQDKGAIDCNLS